MPERCAWSTDIAIARSSIADCGTEACENYARQTALRDLENTYGLRKTPRAKVTVTLVSGGNTFSSGEPVSSYGNTFSYANSLLSFSYDYAQYRVTTVVDKDFS